MQQIDVAGGRPAWRVTQITDDIQITATGATAAKRISVEMFDGQRFDVVVPVSDFTPQKVRQVVDQMARTHNEVAALEGDYLPADLTGS